MTWTPGADRVRELLDSGELERVEPSAEVAQMLLAEAERHIASARAISEAGDQTGAYQLAYDAIRKSAASLLAAQGIRATSRGGHIAVQDAVIAQFGKVVPAFHKFGRLRRNRFEYPGDPASEPTEDEVADVISNADDVVSRAQTIPDQAGLDPWDG